jgi:hypothetical protein
LRQITTPEAANAFLPAFLADFNARFTRTPAEAAPPGAAPRAISPSCSAVAIRAGSPATTRSTSGRAGSSSRPAPTSAPIARCRVELRELLDGRLVVLHAGAVLATQPAPSDFTLTPHSAPSSDRRHAAQRPAPTPSAAFTRVRGPAHGSGSTRRPRDKVYSSLHTALGTPRGAPPVAQGPYQKGPGPVPRTGMTFSCCS